MKKSIVSALAASLLLSLSSCSNSTHFYAENEEGNRILVHNVNPGPLFYYPGMVLWNVGIAAPVTVAEFYTCFILFVPVAALTNNGSFIGCPDFLQKTMGFVIFDNHLPFLPASAIDYELQSAKDSKSKIQVSIP